MSDYIKTIPEQIEHLKELGLIIPDDAKASEILSDIGFYRLGFYMFPFEKKYPPKPDVTILSRMASRWIRCCDYTILTSNSD